MQLQLGHHAFDVTTRALVIANTLVACGYLELVTRHGYRTAQGVSAMTVSGGARVVASNQVPSTSRTNGMASELMERRERTRREPARREPARREPAPRQPAGVV